MQAVVGDERSYKHANFHEAVQVMERTHQLTPDKQYKLQQLTNTLRVVQGQVEKEDEVRPARYPAADVVFGWV